MKWILVLALFLLGSFLQLGGIIWRRGRYRAAFAFFSELVVVTAAAALLFTIKPTLPQRILRLFSYSGGRWAISLTLFFLGVLIKRASAFARAPGVKATIEAAGASVAVSAGAAAFVFIFLPSTWPAWLLLIVPVAVLLLVLSPFVRGLLPGTVRLKGITLDSVTTGSKGLLRVAHLSDLHVCVTPAMEGALPADRVAQATAQALRWALDRADFVLITGDLTDNGSGEEWHRLSDIVTEVAAERAAQLFFVPGNHDLAITLTYSTTDDDGNLLLQHEEQHRQFATSLLRRCAAGWRVVTRQAEISLSDVFSQAESYIQQYDTTPPAVDDSFQALKWRLRASGKPANRAESLLKMQPSVRLAAALTAAAASQAPGVFWPSSERQLFMDLVRETYPIVFHEDRQYVFIGLNSNTAMAESIFTGAFGMLGDEQLARLDTILSRSGDRCKVIIVHHHTGQPVSGHGSDIVNSLRLRTLQLRDASKLHKVLSRYRRVVVFHGHKHMGYHATRNNVLIVSSPSVAYGDERSGGPNCFVYEIDPNGEKPADLVRIVETASITAM